MNVDEGLKLLENFSKDFEKFYKILYEANKIMNLTAVCDEKGVKYKHFLDSILPADLIPYGARVAEIGSGGGFPSIPLKIIRRDLSFTLVESTKKKCEYLKDAVKKLGLENMEVLPIRAEDGGRNPALREKFDVCVARAVANLSTLAEYCLPYVKVGGIFIAYKGDAEEEIKAASNAVKKLGGKFGKTRYYELLEDFGKRCAVVVEKVEKTPPLYPRGQGRERKNPL